MPLDIITVPIETPIVVGTVDNSVQIGGITSSVEVMTTSELAIISTTSVRMEVVTVGVQGPPSAQTAVWTYVQEATPTGGEGFTWFKPSINTGHVWTTGYGWQKFLTENLTEDNINHGVDIFGGYY